VYCETSLRNAFLSSADEPDELFEESEELPELWEKEHASNAAQASAAAMVNARRTTWVIMGRGSSAARSLARYAALEEEGDARFRIGAAGREAE
jgi:hypothetical protein